MGAMVRSAMMRIAYKATRPLASSRPRLRYRICFAAFVVRPSSQRRRGSASYAATRPLLPSYQNWDAGLAWKAFTLDLRYYGTNLSRGNCSVFSSDQTATPSAANVSATNPLGLGSSWCSAAFIAKLSFQTTVANLK
jgi:hypothetical protein